MSTPRTQLLTVIILAFCNCAMLAQGSPTSWTRDTFDSAAVNKERGGSPSAIPSHTLQIGRTGVDLKLSDELEYSDNVRVEPKAREGMSNTLNLSFDSMWSPTKIQDIAISGSIGNRIPIYGPGKGRALWNVAPNTALKMNIFVDQLRLSPFVRASRSLDPVAATVVSQTQNYTTTSKDAGILAEYPLYKANLQIIGLAGTKDAGSDNSPAMTTNRYSAAIRGSKTFVPESAVGVDFTAFTQDYDNGPANKSYGQGVSAFARWPLSKLVSGELSAGYDSQSFSKVKDKTDSKRVSEPFFMASLNHRANADFSYVVSVRRGVFDGVSTAYYKSTEYSFGPTYNASQSLSINATVAYKTADESTKAGDHGHSVNASIGGRYTTKGGTNFAVNYNYVDKISSNAQREYTQNRFTLSVSRAL